MKFNVDVDGTKESSLYQIEDIINELIKRIEVLEQKIKSVEPNLCR